MASDWCDDPELGQMRADGIDHRGLLADKQVTRTVQRQAALLLWCLGRDEPHVRPGDRLARRSYAASHRASHNETDCRDRLHDLLLRIVGALTAPTSMALTCRWRSRPQHQKRTFVG
jgi:hypothetical protein